MFHILLLECLNNNLQLVFQNLIIRSSVAFCQTASVGKQLDHSFFIAEPRRWSAADVAAWVQWARRQLQLPSVPLESFNVDGATLASLTEEEFCQRAPQVSTVYLHLFFILRD